MTEGGDVSAGLSQSAPIITVFLSGAQMSETCALGGA